MKKIYSVLMASAVALSASALSIETAELGAVQDFTLPEGLAPAKTLSVNTPVKYAPAKVAKTNFTGKNFINAAKAVNPRSRVLGGSKQRCRLLHVYIRRLFRKGTVLLQPI